MNRSNTRESRRRREQTQSHDTRRDTPSGKFFRMPSVFNIIRASLYAAVLVWTVICLAIAVHFHGLLVSSDLTRFVPFAIFVCSVSLLLIIALLGFGLWKDRNSISTRIEMGCLTLTGILWLALGAFLASSDSEVADVECFSSADDTEPFDMPGFNTETYHAQYRVIEAFSFFNVILIFGFLSMLLFLAIRHSRWGTKHVWTSSVTAFPWFAGAGAQTGKLPAPVTQPERTRSRSRRAPVPTYAATPAPTPPPAHEKPRHRERERDQAPRRLPQARHSPTRNESPTYVYWLPHKAPAADRAHATDYRSRDPYHRDASPRR